MVVSIAEDLRPGDFVADCPVCSGVAGDTFSAARGQRVRQCVDAGCGHLFVADRQERQGVEREEFSPAQVVESADSLKAEFSERNERLIEYWEQREFLPMGAKVLDFGSSVGHVVQSLATRRPDLEIQCIEASAPSRDYLASEGLQVAGSIEDVSERFDAILMIEVIEHIPEPVAVLSALRRRLKPWGRIFITTPCGQLRSGSRKTHAYDQPEHIHFFTERSLQTACRRAGMMQIDFEFVAAMYPLPLGAIGKLAAKARHSASRLRSGLEGHRHLVGFTSA
jgi:2-polyprenyl-3-methyl-5-hydroxy-6-metoxy-1,4-benzoquinol methylase